jgi:hypothetical protein
MSLLAQTKQSNVDGLKAPLTVLTERFGSLDWSKPTRASEAARNRDGDQRLGRPRGFCDGDIAELT